MALPGRWPLKWIALTGSLVLVSFALLAVIALVVGHLRIAGGTASIEQVTVPVLLETTRVVRNLENLRRFGDLALHSDSAIQRGQAQMSVTLIVTHPSMQDPRVQSRVRHAERTLAQALALISPGPPDPRAHDQAEALWAPAAEDLTLLADELTRTSSRRAIDDATQIHDIADQMLMWLTAAISALLVGGLLFGAFLLRFVARPLQSTARELDRIESGESREVDLAPSPVREIERLRAATHALAAAQANAERSRRELAHLASTDDLTGLCNRRHFIGLAGIEWMRAQRYQRSLAMLMVDIDHFKSINDRFGHAAGDEVIVGLANHLRAVVRGTDHAARVGGEEFAVLMPEADAAAARSVAERLRAEVAAESVNLSTGNTISITVSVGVAVADAADEGFDQLMRRADEALYAAKRAGRNRVELAA